MRSFILFILSAFAIAMLNSCGAASSGEMADRSPAEMPAAAVDPAKLQTAVFAGGCFWGVEAVFEHTRGVAGARSGYAGGTADTANYEAVGTGKTRHAEAVEVRFDSEKVTYEQLLDVFFKVAHNPTELNRQGPDVGPQYRSAIFYSGDEQKNAALNFIDKMGREKIYKDPIVTEVVPLENFYEAEEYHQNYLVRNPKDPYIVYHDIPKLENLKKQYPALYVKR